MIKPKGAEEKDEEWKIVDVSNGILFPIYAGATVLGILEVSNLSDFEGWMHYQYMGLLLSNYLSPLIIRLAEANAKENLVQYTIPLIFLTLLLQKNEWVH